jgi:uncharacterized membrane protein YraQ (UPF0718 family)
MNSQENRNISSPLLQAMTKSLRSLYSMLPMIIGTMLLVSLVPNIIPHYFYARLFQHNIWFDSLIGSIVGSISGGYPITSYILGGEFLKEGVSLVAVTAFMVSWVTVGMIQLPAEAMILGKRFAVLRNLTSFFLAIIVGIITVLIVNVL